MCIYQNTLFAFLRLLFKYFSICGLIRVNCSLARLLGIECTHWGLAAPCSRLGIRFWTERTPFLQCVCFVFEFKLLQFEQNRNERYYSQMQLRNGRSRSVFNFCLVNFFFFFEFCNILLATCFFVTFKSTLQLVRSEIFTLGFTTKRMLELESYCCLFFNIPNATDSKIFKCWRIIAIPTARNSNLSI